MRYNEKTKAYTMQYAVDNLKRVPLDMQKSEYDAVKNHASGMGEKVNTFIKRAIKETMERDKGLTEAEHRYYGFVRRNNEI